MSEPSVFYIIFLFEMKHLYKQFNSYISEAKHKQMESMFFFWLYICTLEVYLDCRTETYTNELIFFVINKIKFIQFMKSNDRFCQQWQIVLHFSSSNIRFSTKSFCIFLGLLRSQRSFHAAKSLILAFLIYSPYNINSMRTYIRTKQFFKINIMTAFIRATTVLHLI